ncbi:MAG: restriction endonuclease [Planctomycetes bacterium]|nr:restriction endonuclease [Planctomycetota bacterium]
MFNLLVVFGVLIVSGIVFVLFTGFSGPKKGAGAAPEEGFPPAPPLGMDALVERAEALLARYAIRVEGRAEGAPGEVTLLGASDDPLLGGRYIVTCLTAPEGGVVPSTRLLEFRDEVKANGATKGVFMTDGAFGSDARFLLEDAPVTLLDRTDLARPAGAPGGPGTLDESRGAS